MTRKFSSISVETTLASGISDSATSMTVALGTGSSLLGGVTLAAGNVDQFTVALDPDTNSEEIVFITAVSSDTFTIVRGRAGTTAIAHSAGATVKHVLTSDDLNAFNAAVSPVANIQFSGSSSGTLTVQAAAVAGTNTITFPAVTDTLASLTATQTLTNKTLTSPTITSPIVTSLNLNDSSIVFEGSTADAYETTLTVADPTADRTITLPNASGNVLLNEIQFNAQTGTTYTLALTDSGKLVTLSNASPITLTIPTNASVAFPVGAQVHIQQIGAAAVTVSGDTGVTLNAGGTTTRGQWSAATLIKTDTNTWTMVGAIE
jgi:hypothetical protein